MASPRPPPAQSFELELPPRPLGLPNGRPGSIQPREQSHASPGSVPATSTRTALSDVTLDIPPAVVSLGNPSYSGKPRVLSTPRRNSLKLRLEGLLTPRGTNLKADVPTDERLTLTLPRPERCERTEEDPSGFGCTLDATSTITALVEGGLAGRNSFKVGDRFASLDGVPIREGEAALNLEAMYDALVSSGRRCYEVEVARPVEPAEPQGGITSRIMKALAPGPSTPEEQAYLEKIVAEARGGGAFGALALSGAVGAFGGYGMMGFR